MKLIIDIPVEKYNEYKRIGDSRDVLFEAIRNGTPLDSNSERAEVQAYFDGEAYGWEQGRKALIDDVKAEMLKYSSEHYVHDDDVWTYIGIIDRYIGKAESEEVGDEKKDN